MPQQVWPANSKDTVLIPTMQQCFHPSAKHLL